MQCSRCDRTTKVELIQSDKGYAMGYHCSACRKTVFLTANYPTAAQAKAAWNNR